MAILSISDGQSDRKPVVTFILVKFLSTKLFKRGVIPRKKIESKCPVDMHIYMVGPPNYKVSGNSVERFQRSCADSFSSICHFGQISKFKKSVIPRK